MTPSPADAGPREDFARILAENGVEAAATGDRHIVVVDHSTISRLIRGDRMPSLGTATKLARGLRELRDDAPRVEAVRQHHHAQLPVRQVRRLADEARRLWAKQLEQRIRDTSPADIPSEPLVGHVAPGLAGSGLVGLQERLA